MFKSIVLIVPFALCNAIGFAGDEERFFTPAKSANVLAEDVSTDSIEQLAYHHLCLREYGQAKDLALKAKMEPHTDLAELILAECLRREGKLQEAMASLDALGEKSQYITDIGILKAFVLLDQSNYKQILSIEPNSGRVNVLLLVKSLASYNLKQFDDALKYSQTYVNKVPYGPKHIPELPFLCLGLAHFGKGNYEAAAESLSSGIRINANSIALNYSYGRALIESGRFREAKAVVTRLNMIAPNRPETIHVSAEYFYLTRDFEKAVDYLEKLHASDKTNTSVVLHLVYSYAGTSKINRAETLLEAHTTKYGTTPLLTFASHVLTALNAAANKEQLRKSLDFLEAYGTRASAPVSNRIQCAGLLAMHGEYESARTVLTKVERNAQPPELQLEIDRVTLAIESKATIQPTFGP